jgi:hypothetical protein
MDMLRTIVIAATLIAVLPVAPSWAVSSKDKQTTCKFGADSQNLQGPERAAFMKKCMSPKNDPRGPAGGADEAAPKN